MVPARSRYWDDLAEDPRDPTLGLRGELVPMVGEGRKRVSWPVPSTLPARDGLVAPSTMGVVRLE
jgi:hypothetical protein